MRMTDAIESGIPFSRQRTMSACSDNSTFRFTRPRYSPSLSQRERYYAGYR